MIKGKTKSGIKFEIDERILNDWRYQKRLSKLVGLSKKLNGENDTETVAEITETIDYLERLMFGGTEGADEFENVVAQVHGGVCEPSVFQAELMEIINATSKNSSSSQK